MYMCHNLNDTNIWDSLFEDLPKCIKDNESQMPPQVSPARPPLGVRGGRSVLSVACAQALVFVVRALFYSLLWSLHELEERAAKGAGVDPEAAALRERLQAYVQHCRDIAARGATPDLREEVLHPRLRPAPAPPSRGGNARASPPRRTPVCAIC